MKREKTDAIVLQTMPVRERDRLVTFLTPERGKLRAWAYGARGTRSRFGASLEPLAKVRIDYAHKENEDTVRIESIELIRSLFSVQQDLRSSIALSYIAETIDTFAQSDEPSEVVFRLVDRALEALLDGHAPGAVVAYVEVWILKLGGIFPSIRACVDCQRPLERPLAYDHTRSGFVCNKCSDGRTERLPNDVSDLLERIIRLPVEEFARSPIDDRDLLDVRTFSARLRREFLGHELKSWDLLQRVLQNGP